MGEAGNSGEGHCEATVIVHGGFPVKKRRVPTKEMALAMLADSKKTGIGSYRSKCRKFALIPWSSK